MPWDDVNNHFGSPSRDMCPGTLVADNMCQILKDNWAYAKAWFNNRWSNKIHYTLQDIPKENFIVGVPTTTNPGTVFILPDDELTEGDTFDLELIRIYLFYVTGKVQLDGIFASEYAGARVNNYYLFVIREILKSAPDDLYFQNWPTAKPGIEEVASQPPGIRKFFKLTKPSSKLLKEGDPRVGVTGLITADLRVQPYQIFDEPWQKETP